MRKNLGMLAGTTIATMTSLRHRPLAEVCTVPVFLVTRMRSTDERSTSMNSAHRRETE